MTNCKAAITPMNLNEKLNLNEKFQLKDGTEEADAASFRSLVGDSDWAGSVDDKRSTLGFVFNLGSGAKTWSSKKQGVTMLSTAEAEYVAATSSACQAVWLRRLLADMEQEQNEGTEIFCDNR
ncbi:hypothetical protein SASPL_104723 [Salvia splendens]|uniref:Uncharacterized protein n=1 Tax=Salvia splendens TaxID=180675 RepID=A0A8X8YII8_SALSN|nr:hypothetical protein SASPL_104723 [Salvia splendens]